MNEMNHNKTLEQNRKPVVLDDSYPYEELLMIIPSEKMDENTKPDLPGSVRFAKISEVKDLKNKWADLMRRLKFPNDIPEEEIFDRMRNQDPEFFDSHLFALLSEDDDLVSVVGIWPGRHFEDGMRVHWMMSSPDYQSKGYGRMVLQQAIRQFHQEFPNKSLYLSTQAQSWPAIRMYKKMGFGSYEDDCLTASKEENVKRWENARRQVLAKEGINI